MPLPGGGASSVEVVVSVVVVSVVVVSVVVVSSVDEVVVVASVVEVVLCVVVGGSVEAHSLLHQRAQVVRGLLKLRLQLP